MLMKRLARGALLDTNVLLRFLLGDDPIQSARAKSLIMRLQGQEESAELTDGVLAETVWVLEKGLDVPRAEIVRYMTTIVSIPGMTYARGKRTLLRALGTYNATNCDIVDCLLAAQARGRNQKVYTFDTTDFKKLECTWEEPA